MYESGVTGFHLQRELEALGVDCVIGAVSKMDKPAAEKRKKTDRRDAAFLARQLALGTVSEVHVPDPAYEAAHNMYSFGCRLSGPSTKAYMRGGHCSSRLRRTGGPR